MRLASFLSRALSTCAGWSILVLVICTPASAAAPTGLVQTARFINNADGYNTYRIPSIIRARDGGLLAFVEGRRAGRGNSGDIDMVVKRSNGGGRTWSPQSVIWDDTDNTCGN